MNECRLTRWPRIMPQGVVGGGRCNDVLKVMFRYPFNYEKKQRNSGITVLPMRFELGPPPNKVRLFTPRARHGSRWKVRPP
jgi:hypothetical protein